MKKLSKITLAKTYDVLSENEMKKVVGGMGSGSGSGSPVEFVVCENIYSSSACGGYCKANSTTVGKCHFHTELGPDTGCWCDVY